MGVSPPMGIRQTPACQIQLPCHELPPPPPPHPPAPVMHQTLLVQRLSRYPTHLPSSCIKHCSFRDYLKIPFRFQNTPERGVAFQIATFRHQYTWENGFVWESMVPWLSNPSYSSLVLSIIQGLNILEKSHQEELEEIQSAHMTELQEMQLTLVRC